MVSTQDEDLFSLLRRLSEVKENMRKYHTDLPDDQAKLSHIERAEAHRVYWAKLCDNERRLIDQLALIGTQFREAKDPT